MPTTIKDLGPCEKEVEVVIEADDIQAALKRHFRELRGQVAIPGFRPGKVPMSILERRFGDEMRGQVLDELVNDAIRDAVKEHDLKPLGSPDVADAESLALPEDGALSFTFKLDVQPVFELPKYRGLAVTRKTHAVTDEDVENVLSRLAERRAEYLPVEDDDAAYVAGDVVQGMMKATAGETVVAQDEMVMFSSEHPHLGHIELVDADALFEGLKLDAAVTAKGIVGDRHADEALRGAEVDLEIEVQEFKRRSVPAIDDEFAKGMGEESLDELKSKIREDLGKSHGAAADVQVEEDLVTKVLENVEIALPTRLVEEATQRATQQRLIDLISRQALKKDEAEEKLAAEKDEIRAEVERNFREELLLDAIGAKEKIFALEDDITAELQRIAAENDTTVSVVRDYYQKQGTLSELRGRIRERKVREWLREQAKITEEVAEKGEGDAASNDEAS